MKVVYNKKPIRGEYNAGNFFTYGKEYKVIADYRKRKQQGKDNGFVVEDNTGSTNMIYKEDAVIIEDGEPCYVFEYNN